MSFIPYISNINAWKQVVANGHSDRFNVLQKGKGGSSVQVISPEQGIVERAKSELKNNLNKSNLYKIKQSTSALKRSNTSPPRKKKRSTIKAKAKKKSKAKPRKKKKTKIKKSVKRLKRKKKKL